MDSKQEIKNKGILLETGTNEVEFLEFIIGGQSFGVNVAKVTQVLVWRDQHLTRLPQNGSFCLGTVPFRKKHISVMDLRSYLGIKEAPLHPEKQLLLVVEFNKVSKGYIVDGVEEIQRVSWDKFVPLQDTAFGKGNNCITGSVIIDNRVIMIVDLEGMMAQLDDARNPGSYNQEARVSNLPDRSNIRIVYCEDSAMVQRITVNFLKDSGFENIKVFSSGQEGLDYLQSSENNGVDLILSDIEMPKLDGLALCKTLKSDSKYQKVPFVFFSSIINEEMRKKCEGIKCDAAFSKPQMKLIVEFIEQYYGKNKSGSTSVR